MDKERVDEIMLHVIKSHEENLPVGLTNFYQALLTENGANAVQAFEATNGWANDNTASLSLRLSAKMILETLGNSKDIFITHIDDVFKLGVYFDEPITKAFILMAGTRVKLLNGSKVYDADIYADKDDITKYIESSEANPKIRLGAMKLYAMLENNLPTTDKVVKI